MLQGNELHRENVFHFQKRNGGRKESVVWRAIAITSTDVHDIGRAKEEKDNSVAPERGISYVGFLSAEVKAIRDIQGMDGHGFEVVHFPSEGRHHAHIELLTGPGVSRKQFRNAIKVRLFELFLQTDLMAA